MFITGSVRKKAITRGLIILLAAAVTLALYILGRGRGDWTYDALIYVSVFCFAAAVVYPMLVVYHEGKWRLTSLGNRAVMDALLPDVFLSEYEKAKNAPDNVSSKPSFSLLLFKLVAHELKGDGEGTAATLDEMERLYPKGGKNAITKATRAEDEYEKGSFETGERLLAEAERSAKGLRAKATVRNVRSSARAIAAGDFVTAESYYIRLTSATGIARHPNAAVLIGYFRLAEICRRTDRPKDAKRYLEICRDSGKDTVFAQKARKMINERNYKA